MVKAFVDALIASASDPTIMERQIDRTRDRMNMGVDIHGNPFAPYHAPPRPRQVGTPLVSGASRLLEGARVEHVTSFNGFELRASVSGLAGRIGSHQNLKRQFWGFSDTDKEAIVSDLLELARRTK